MRTLVLNAGYEPLAVITFRRALVLVLTGKASVVAEGDDPVVGPTDVLGRPSVILLNRYIRPRYNHSTAVSRRGVLRRDGHKCAYCGKAAHTIDHVHPKSRGGADSWENLVAACLQDAAGSLARQAGVIHDEDRCHQRASLIARAMSGRGMLASLRPASTTDRGMP